MPIGWWERVLAERALEERERLMQERYYALPAEERASR